MGTWDSVYCQPRRSVADLCRRFLCNWDKERAVHSKSHDGSCHSDQGRSRMSGFYRGLYGDNGKENGNYRLGFRVFIGVKFADSAHELSCGEHSRVLRCFFMYGRRTQSGRERDLKLTWGLSSITVNTGSYIWVPIIIRGPI